MAIQMTTYDGPGYVGKGVNAPPVRDGIKKTLRATIKTFRDLGTKALNAADYERTRHLPIGQGRLACDPETGDFDEDAPRKPYNPANFPKYPLALHSTITEGESIMVRNEDEEKSALATKKWSMKPLEKKRRFTLSHEDTLLNLQAQVQAERAGRLEIERRLENTITGGNVETATMMGQLLEEEKKKREDLEARFNKLMAAMEAQGQSEDISEIEPEKDLGGIPKPRGRRTVAA